MDDSVVHKDERMKVYIEKADILEEASIVCCMDNTLKLNFKIYIFLIFAYNQLN